jgi:hypothetical protein
MQIPYWKNLLVQRVYSSHAHLENITQYSLFVANIDVHIQHHKHGLDEVSLYRNGVYNIFYASHPVVLYYLMVYFITVENTIHK